MLSTAAYYLSLAALYNAESLGGACKIQGNISGSECVLLVSALSELFGFFLGPSEHWLFIRSSGGPVEIRA